MVPKMRLEKKQLPQISNFGQKIRQPLNEPNFSYLGQKRLDPN